MQPVCVAFWTEHKKRPDIGIAMASVLCDRGRTKCPRKLGKNIWLQLAQELAMLKSHGFFEWPVRIKIALCHCVPKLCCSSIVLTADKHCYSHVAATDKNSYPSGHFAQILTTRYFIFSGSPRHFLSFPRCWDAGAWTWLSNAWLLAFSPSSTFRGKHQISLCRKSTLFFFVS